MKDKLMTDVLDKQKFGSNVYLVAEEKDCFVLRLEAPTGEGYMTMYQVMPSIYLMFNEFHLESCESKFQNMDTVFCIDHCRQGRMEYENSLYGRYYMESGDIRLDKRSHHSGNFNMPTRYYHGITIGFEIGKAEESIKRELPGVQADIGKIVSRFCPDENEFLMRKERILKNDETLIGIFDELYGVPKEIRIEFFKVKIMELILRLSILETSLYKDENLYIPGAQADRIKRIHKLIIDNPEKNYTVEELSKRFDIPESTLRKNFRVIYGSPIYQYIKNHKMSFAAELLRSETDIKISDIAERVGYDNPSKFSAAFKCVMGVTPVVYRNDQ